MATRVRRQDRVVAAAAAKIAQAEFSLLWRDASQSLCFCNCAADYSEVHSCDSVECEIGGVNLAIVFR